MKELTMIIKTFERPECVLRLVKSIYRYYPDAKVLIGDDSEISCKAEIEKRYPTKDIKVFELPQDCGLSYGRNFLLKQTKTPYFLLLDDDFVFDKKVKIEENLELLKAKKVDILGGYMRNYKIVNGPLDRIIVLGQKICHYELATNYIGTLRQEGATLYADYKIYDFPDYVESDLVANFFIGKTKKILEENPWDEELKLHEHTAFFYAAKKKKFKVAFTNHLSIRHMPIQMKKYSSFRGRNFTQVFMAKNKLEKIVNTYDDPKRNKTILLGEETHEG